MTFKVTYRGSPSPRTLADYHCEKHGRFELDVARTPEGDAPDEVFCPAHGCGLTSTWCISAPLARVNPIEAVKGGWTRPERPTYTDTRNLGEGQALYDWKSDRAEVWERRRQADVMKFAKEH